MALGATVGISGCAVLTVLGINPAGGWKRQPWDEMPPGAAKLVERALTGFSAEAPPVDYHVHFLDVGTGRLTPGRTDGWVNEDLTGLELASPKRRVRGAAFMSAAAIRTTEPTAANQQFRQRLNDLVLHAPEPFRSGRFHLLAFDATWTPNSAGEFAPSEEKTDIFVSVDRVLEFVADPLASGTGSPPDTAITPNYVAVASIHPERGDAINRLKAAHAKGVRFVKWVPQAQNIDPGSCTPAYRAFYSTMAAKRMVLLSHAGEEGALETMTDDQLGDPYELRLALAHGVKVIVAHAAGDRFLRFLELMDAPEYSDRLFGEISALTQTNRIDTEMHDQDDLYLTPIRDLLFREDLWPRLVNGSDYPLPATNALISTRKLVGSALIKTSERDALAEVYHYNPLLFDLVVKRTISVPYGEEPRRFPPSVFQENRMIADTQNLPRLVDDHIEGLCEWHRTVRHTGE